MSPALASAVGSTLDMQLEFSSPGSVTASTAEDEDVTVWQITGSSSGDNYSAVFDLGDPFPLALVAAAAIALLALVA